MLNVRLACDHLYGKLLFTWLSLVMSMVVSFCAVFFPTRCLGWDLELNWISFWGFSYLLLLPLISPVRQILHLKLLRCFCRATWKFRIQFSDLWVRSTFSSAGKFCLAYGLGKLTCDVKSDVSSLNLRSDVTFASLQETPNDVRNRSLCDVKCKKGKKWRNINNNFNVIGKKNNQSSVSDANQEIPYLGSTDNAGNSVNLVSGIIRLPSDWNFSVCIEDRW